MKAAGRSLGEMSRDNNTVKGYLKRLVDTE